MAASIILMEDSLLKVLRNGDLQTFQSLLDSELEPRAVIVVDIPDDSQPQAPQTGEAAATNSIPQGLIVPPVRSMLLRRVTSAGDGVLHIAARHGHLNLVRAVFGKAGITEADPEQGESAEEAREEVREELEEQWGSFKAMMKRLCQWAKSCHRMEEDAGEVAPAVVKTGVAAGVEAAESSAASSSRRHGENAAQGREEAQMREVELALQPAPAVAGADPQHHDQDDDAAQGTIKFVELLRAKNHRGETCLHEAVRWGHTMIVRELIAGDAKLHDGTTTPPLVQIKDNDGASPLYLATTLRRHDIVECLTDRNYRYIVSYDGPAGKTALHAAVLLNTGLCDLLLKWNKNLAKCKDESGMTPLHYLGTSDTAITELILDHDVSSGYYKGSAGSLPIHVAASRGRLDIIKKLLEKCPNCDSSCNEDGQTFLHVAILEGHAKIVKYVCTDPRFAQLLNTRDKNGNTALHLAVQNGDENIFCSLFGSKEIVLSFINKEGRTPVDLAFLSKEPDHGLSKQRKQAWILNDLLVAGADFCTCRWDHFSCSRIEKPRDEKECEKLSKSAGLIATAATLILSMSFAAPFTFSDKNLPTGNGDADSHVKDSSAQKRAQRLKILFESTTSSLIESSLALFFCIIAGFHASRIRTRSASLIFGGLSLYIAAQDILTVFAMGLFQVSPSKMAPHYIWFVKTLLNVYCIVVAFGTVHPFQVLAHVRARSSRLGLQASLCSLFRRPCGVPPIPLFHSTAVGALFLAWIFTTVWDLKIMIKN